MGPMQKTGRSVEYVVWCVIRLNNTATPVCIEIHLGRTLPYNEHTTKDKTTKCPQHHHRQACKFEVDTFSNANTRFNKIATQGAPQMAVDKEDNSLSRVYSYYSKFNLCLFYVYPALARYLSILFLNILTLLAC